MTQALICIGGYLAIALVLAIIMARTTRDELAVAWMIAWPLTLPVILIGAFAEWLCDR